MKQVKSQVLFIIKDLTYKNKCISHVISLKVKSLKNIKQENSQITKYKTFKISSNFIKEANWL